MAAHEDVDGYLADLGDGAREAVARIRRLVHEQVPGVTETIRYDMPTFQLDGRSLLHVAGWAKHVSIYPEPGGDAELSTALAPYSSGRGTLKFPLDDVPYDLVARAVAALAQERGTA